MERNGLLAAGNFVVDHVKIVDRYPDQDGLGSIIHEKSGNGGGPYNILKDLVKMGAHFPLAAIGLVGDDADGRWILDDCARHGIDTDGLIMAPDLPTSYTDVMSVQSTGRRTFFHQRGANAKLGQEHFQFEKSTHKLFHLGYFMLLDTLDELDSEGRSGASRVLEAARIAGLQTCADCVSIISERFKETVLPSLPFLDYFVLNELEASQITGLPLVESGEVDPDLLAQAAVQLLELGVHRLAVIHCAKGAVAAQREGGVYRIGSVLLPADRIAGANGAGDAFAAGLLYALHENRPVEEALELATCVAASGLLSETTSDGILPWEKCLALGKTFGYHSI